MCLYVGGSQWQARSALKAFANTADARCLHAAVAEDAYSVCSAEGLSADPLKRPRDGRPGRGRARGQDQPPHPPLAAACENEHLLLGVQLHLLEMPHKYSYTC